MGGEKGVVMKNGKILLTVGLGCGAIAALGLVASCAGVIVMGVRSASAVNGEISLAVDDLLDAAENGSFAETYQSAATPELRQATSAADYAKLGEVIHTQLGALKSKRIATFFVRQLNANSFADVVFDAEFERGKGTIRATLKRSGNRWLFVSFRVDSPAMMQDLPDRTCPKCGGKYASSARFCPHCGQAVPDVKE